MTDPAPTTVEPACSIMTAPVGAVREPPLPTTLHSFTSGENVSITPFTPSTDTYDPEALPYTTETTVTLYGTTTDDNASITEHDAADITPGEQPGTKIPQQVLKIRLRAGFYISITKGDYPLSGINTSVCKGGR